MIKTVKPPRRPASRLSWLLLVLTIPGQRPALRMRVWRKLKAFGAGVLRDGVYVMPNRLTARAVLAAQAEEVIAAGGAAQLLDVGARETDFASLFDRTDEYRDLIAEISAVALVLRSTSRTRGPRDAERLRREFEAIVSRDFFPGTAQDQARRALDQLRALAERFLNPDEPHAAHSRLRRLDRSEHQGRIWATRERPWVDRLASAWLIKRFIDPKAKIKWLKRPTRQPVRVLGFDFDGATFSHVDDKVTFEVLMHSFGLDDDPGLQKLGAIVHYLDVGGLPVPEAAMLETILRGMRARVREDDRLLTEASVLFDDLYAGYAKASAAS